MSIEYESAYRAVASARILRHPAELGYGYCEWRIRAFRLKRGSVVTLALSGAEPTVDDLRDPQEFLVWKSELEALIEAEPVDWLRDNVLFVHIHERIKYEPMQLLSSPGFENRQAQLTEPRS